MITRLKELKEEREEGFTLIELLVVILIIGILAAIAIPLFLNQRKSAVDAGVQSDVKNSGDALGGKIKQSGPVTMADLREDMPVFSQGNVISLSGTYDQGFCVQGYNPDGNRDETSPVAYDSLSGGMLREDDTPQACPADVLVSPMASSETTGGGETPGDGGGAVAGEYTVVNGDPNGTVDVDVDGTIYKVRWVVVSKDVVGPMGNTYQEKSYRVTSETPFDGQTYAGNMPAGGGSGVGSTTDSVNGVSIHPIMSSGSWEEPVITPINHVILYIGSDYYEGTIVE